MDKEKQALEVAAQARTAREWLRGLESQKDNMTVLHGISMSVSGGGHYRTRAAWAFTRQDATS
ncbi:MAG: hypothetical protein R3C01_12870 [Planctomycetaceae bacterium]